MTFNPNEHLMKLGYGDKAQDYLQVMWRIVWFRDHFPQGTIDTEEIIVDLDREVEAEDYVWNPEKKRKEKVIKRAQGYARFRAVVTDGKGGRSTGHKSENAASFPDFIEKAETGAIGRALAGLGYGTQFTGDEFNEGSRIVDSPVGGSVNDSEREHNNPADSRGATATTPSQNTVTSSMIDKAKSDWAKAYNIADEEIEDRWIKYKVYKLGRNVADPDIQASQLGMINGDITAQVRKSNKAS